MYLPILAAILIPLIWAPLETERIYCDALKREGTRIALDNAGIVMGERDREIFNGLVWVISS